MGWIFKLAWRNLWRNRNRTLITSASVMFAVLLSVLIQSLQTGVFDHLIDNVVRYYSSYIQLHTAGYTEEQTLERVMDDPERLMKLAESQANVSRASARIETFVLASSGENTRGCMLTGIEPEKEKEIIALHQKISGGRYLKSADRGLLVGDELAKRLGLKLNDTLVLLGQGFQGSTAAGKYPIQGILHFGSPELNQRLLFMPIRLCREFLDMRHQATTIVIALNKTKELKETQAALATACGSKIEVINWEEMMPDIVEHMKSDKGTGKIVSLILYLLVSFGIFSTLLMMMAERQFELGMLLAIGMKKSRLSLLLIIESVFISLSGTLAGCALSIPLVWYLKINPIRFSGEFAEIYQRYGFEPVIPTSTDPSIFIYQSLTILGVSLLLSTYSLYKIMRMDPVKAMKP